MKRYVDQGDHHGHFHQRADDRGKLSSRVDPEDRDRYGDRQFEIV